MQKIKRQRLSGSLEEAEKKAKYTWGKAEMAYYFCTTYKEVFKVQFTGKRWLAGNAWGRKKIYQYKYIEGSGHMDTVLNTRYGISHDEEKVFFSEKKEALRQGMNYLNRRMAEEQKRYSEAADRLFKYLG